MTHMVEPQLREPSRFLDGLVGGSHDTAELLQIGEKLDPTMLHFYCDL